jgi:glycosyltransferase involved in cell wall biosynthesis
VGAVKVAIVMPPVTEGEPSEVVASWGTVTAAATALLATGEVVPVVHCRHRTAATIVTHAGVDYRFHTSDAALVREVRAEHPDVVHVHGLGWSRLLLRMRKLPAPIVLQHHGEPQFTGRTRLAHRMVRGRVAAYLFTGAVHGQAEPWIDAGVIRADARLCEVLEAAALWTPTDTPAVSLEGAPAVLWVGRLIAGKDPLAALDAVALALRDVPDVHLHLLATDRTMERAVRARIDDEPALQSRVHVHDPVPVGEIERWYRGAPVFLSTSHREGSGYSLIEALTCGCAPVVTAIPPHLAILDAAAASVVGTFPPGDAPAAAAALVQVVGRLPSTGEPNVNGGRSLLDWTGVGHQLVAAYRSVLPRDG